MVPNDDGTNRKVIEDLKKEVDGLRHSVAKQTFLTSQEAQRIEWSIADEERLTNKENELEAEIIELAQLAVTKGDEKTQKIRDLYRVKHHYNQVKEEVQMKQIQLEDHKKKDRELQTRIKEFAQLYDAIKSERNKCVSLIQASTQKATEVKEKLKIFDNETEILRTSVGQKEKQLQKQRTKHISSVLVRDSLRTEVAKQRALADDITDKQDQLRIDIDILNMMINRSEELMVQLRKRYEEEIQKRNDRGVQLIERNDEVCIFYERVNRQDQMLRNGEVEMQARDEEIRFLRMQLAEEQRVVSLMKRSLPSKKATEEEIVTLQIELAQCCDRQMELEKQIENPDHDRIRLVGGKDLKPVEVQKKIDDVEVRLADKEEQSLEKDLIYQQVCRLTDRVAAKVDADKDDTLLLAKKVNSIQAKIKNMTRQMMATVAELSMYQANALRLQQEVKDKEALLERYYVNMEKGLPPSVDIEHEFLRQVHTDEQRQRERQKAKLSSEEAEMYTLPNGTVTTAEPRPSAYLPSVDHDLQLPRPYGSHAPFRPTESGSNMRHIRKPTVKPIEI